MRIETLSIRAITIIIFMMIGIVAIVLSILAGSYFKQAALDSQMNSLSRVIEVASQEMLKELREQTFDLGMKLGHSKELIGTINDTRNSHEQLVALLDDPFINGFVGFSDVSLERLGYMILLLNSLERVGRVLMGWRTIYRNICSHKLPNARVLSVSRRLMPCGCLQ